MLGQMDVMESNDAVAAIAAAFERLGPARRSDRTS